MPTISKAREVVKILRNSEYRAPRKLDSLDWVAVAEIVTVLEPVHILTLKLQMEKLLLGDFYKHWLELTFQLKAIKIEYSKKILLCIEARFRRSMTRQKIEDAKKHLKQLIFKIQNAREELDVPWTAQQPLFLIDESSWQSSTSLLRSGLREMDGYSSSEENEYLNTRTAQAFAEIENYREKRLDVKDDLSKYWGSQKLELPFIVHSVPATQVSVERSFSTLKLILSDLRYNLSEHYLAAIMMVKLNSEPVSKMKI